MNIEKACAYFDERIFNNPATGCWDWLGCILKSGYGVCNVNGIKTTAHRAQYWMVHGNIQCGHEIHHRCHNPRCVNPDHLESLSIADHARVGQKAIQTHCTHGHEFSPENTYYKVSNGTRVCKKCAAARQRRMRKMK